MKGYLPDGRSAWPTLFNILACYGPRVCDFPRQLVCLGLWALLEINLRSATTDYLSNDCEDL